MISQHIQELMLNSLALVEGLHGTLPLLQFKLHHTSQVCSVGLKQNTLANTFFFPHSCYTVLNNKLCINTVSHVKMV